MGRITQKTEKWAHKSLRDDPLCQTASQTRFVAAHMPGYELTSWRVAFVAGNRIHEYKQGKRLEAREDGLFDRTFRNGQEKLTYPQKEERNYYQKGDILHTGDLDLRQFRQQFPKEYSSESDGFIELLFMILNVKSTIKVGFLIEDINTTDIVNFDGYVVLRRVMFMKDEEGKEIPYPIMTATVEVLNRQKLSIRIVGDWALAENMTALKEVIELWMSVNMTLLGWYVGGITTTVRNQAAQYIVKKVAKNATEKIALKVAGFLLTDFAKDVSVEFVNGVAGRFSARNVRSQITQTTVNEPDIQIYKEVLVGAIIKATTAKLSQITKEGWGKGLVQFIGPNKWKQQLVGIADWLAREIASTTTSAFTETCVLMVNSISNGRQPNNQQLIIVLEPLISSERWRDRFMDLLKDRIDNSLETK